MTTDTIIRLLTIATLSGLLFCSGLRLTWAEITDALRKNHLAWILPVNFILVPILVFFIAKLFQLSAEMAVGMAILAAAPFAPVVPTFARLAKGDLALASVLTGLFPILSAFITPLVCEVSLKPWLQTSSLQFNILSILVLLVSTITLPLVLGVVVRHWAPKAARWLLKPIEVLSEATGTIALIYVVAVDFHSICSIGWKALIAIVLTSELSFLAGYITGGPAMAARFVVGVGTANRNIALALLVAIQSFPGPSIRAAVVANGLLLILLGLVHVGLWRLLAPDKNKV